MFKTLLIIVLVNIALISLSLMRQSTTTQIPSFEVGQNSVSTPCCGGVYLGTPLDSLNLQQLSLEYKSIKNSVCADCDAFGSRYMKVMEELGKLLDGESKERIVEMMGQPDRAEPEKYVYYWRGEHDYLFFIFKNGKAYSEWYYAYD